MDKHAFIAAVAEILEVSPHGLNGQEELGKIGNWDSLSVISFVAMVDTELRRSVEPEKLKQARTLDDLAVLAGV